MRKGTVRDRSYENETVHNKINDSIVTMNREAKKNLVTKAKKIDNPEQGHKN